MLGAPRGCPGVVAAQGQLSLNQQPVLSSKSPLCICKKHRIGGFFKRGAASLAGPQSCALCSALSQQMPPPAAFELLQLLVRCLINPRGEVPLPPSWGSPFGQMLACCLPVQPLSGAARCSETGRAKGAAPSWRPRRVCRHRGGRAGGKQPGRLQSPLFSGQEGEANVWPLGAPRTL